MFAHEGGRYRHMGGASQASHLWKPSRPRSTTRSQTLHMRHVAPASALRSVGVPVSKWRTGLMSRLDEMT